MTSGTKFFDGVTKLRSFSVKFSQSFNEPPQVLYSIKKIKLDSINSSFRYKVYSEGMTAHAMQVNIDVEIFDTPLDFHRMPIPGPFLDGLELQWFAIGY
ncbi:hypothetical protein BpHYR1_048799 [Brachionus plicatilis]|uniref:H-type lectin domain-containing protein n=1 Tax=Brachionus plicatilis TaxID=10195 RepID=A0A3M7RJA2_BRAPC|nr:hypothetical protein BpHYR1_048799 [Brachionus plicatilis]